MKFDTNFKSIIFYAIAVVSVCWCIYRDIKIEKQYTGDLVDRIVGARLQQDGISPYFYHWKVSDGMRYYDPGNNSTTTKINDITASPFFHQLLYPISNFHQRTISKIWLVLEYLALFIMAVIALQFTKTKSQRWAVLFVMVSFLYTYAWENNIERGQMYLFIAFLAMLFYFFINLKSLPAAAFAGIVGISLILIKPTTLLFLFPFLFLLKRYTFKYKGVFLLSSFIVLIFAFGNSKSRLYWTDYSVSINEQIRDHQKLGPTLQFNTPIVEYGKWEGWDTLQIQKDAQKFPYKKSGEFGNVVNFINLGLHVKTPIWVLSALCIIFITLLGLLFIKKFYGTIQLDTFSIAIIGFCMYMASDIFSPLYRHSYNAGQWIFPLLLLATRYLPSSFKKIFIIAIIAGLFLNSLSLRIIPMQNTLGEYIIYASVLGILFTSKPQLLK